MKKLLLVTSLALVSGVASAASYTVTGGNFTSITNWNNNADASVNSTLLYDNGDAAPCVTLSGACNGAFSWTDDASVPQAVPAFSGTYGGTIETDGGGNVTGGSLVISGIIGDQVQVGNNSWWLRAWNNVSINLATGDGTVGSIACYRTPFAPAACVPGVTASMPSAFDLAAGFETKGGCVIDDTCVEPIDGAARVAAAFNAGTGVLTLFKEGRSASQPTGTDTLYEFQLTASEVVVPVPAAVWLFGSALGLLGWVRRRVA
jgi:hypothetical protein